MPDDRTMTIVVHLPQPVDNVSRLLNAVADIWPEAKLDFTGPWKIDIPADER
jgi:hypothetical protein